MQLTLANGFITIEGDERELALYTAILMDVLKRVADRENKEKAKAEADLFAKLANMNFADLMKNENTNENEEEDHD